jgi:hypothetical protein
MLYLFGVGEIPISISGDPAKLRPLLHTTRAVGTVSECVWNEIDEGRARANRETMSVRIAREIKDSLLEWIPSTSRESRRQWGIQVFVRSTTPLWGRRGTPLGRSVSPRSPHPWEPKAGAQAGPRVVHHLPAPSHVFVHPVLQGRGRATLGPDHPGDGAVFRAAQ